MEDLERRLKAGIAALRLLGLTDAATEEQIRAAWKRKVVENRRNGGSDARWRDLNAAKDAALAYIKDLHSLRAHSDAIATAMHDMAESMDRAFAPLRQESELRRRREQRALHEHDRAKAWLDWASPHMNGRYPHPVAQGWFDFGTKPGMELLHPGYDDSTPDAVLKEMQERLDLIQKLHRRELARANRARRHKEWRT